ncbi:hypothetical protein BELL_0029g00080 [Botrytis elliptica]|uniref:F-box domain-containing protein n=1 Tax=Botrytis elliptica TaxID=278938 RepID=A0A4Z1K7L3_9HELO|nr:hypothetical protein BELL_0029g00080 [Botrytis elliptica]
MSVQGMDVLSTSRQLETMSNVLALTDPFLGATMSTDAKDGFGPSLTEILPIEMIQTVCKYLPIKDILNFRLMSNVCAAAGIDRLAENIYVIFTRESFEKLLNISKHPRMSKRVLAIHYDPLRMRAVGEDDYNHLLRDMELQPGSESLTKMARGFEARNKICEEQDFMVKSEFSSFVFSQVLPKLSSLKSFTMVEYKPKQSNHLRLDVKPTPTFCNSMGHNARYHKEASIFLAAAANAGTKLEYLYLERFNLNTLFGASIGTNTTLPYGPDARYLRHLYLWRMMSPTSNSNHRLKQLLQATSNLEYLAITEQFDDTELTKIDWDEIIVGLTMPRLKSVDFWSMVASKSSLTEFLQRHAKTLRILKLRFCSLKESILDWGEVFDVIKSDLTLKEVHFCWLGCLLPEDQHDFDKVVRLEHVYHGNNFYLLLEDCLIRKNLFAKELSLSPSELWQNYILYLKTEKPKAMARLAELESQDLTWDFENDEDKRLFGFMIRL